MRILSKRQLKDFILYSPQHIARLKAAGRFPQRVQFGKCRVGWIEQEALDLMGCFCTGGFERVDLDRRSWR